MPPKKSVLAPTNVNALLNQQNDLEITGAKPAAKAAAAPKTAASNKRKAAEISEPQDDVAEEIDDDDPRLQHIDMNCDQVRRRINNLINSGAMKIGELQSAIGVSPHSYSGFMSKSGPLAGTNFATYHLGWAFFKKRELRGISEPKKKVAKKEEKQALDLSGITLEGEATQQVPIYDTCDEVRKKIRAYLKQANITQAGFLREAAKALPEGKKLQSKQMNEFLGKKGPVAGNTAAMYYAGYVFFEKIRVRDGKAKSAHRLEMERVWRRGVDRETNLDGGWLTMREGESASIDKYGKLSINGRVID